tara:strand:+ start:1792 stop:2055 length:264 start_codon:yes stop_codon:yes gene_type:complete
MIRVVVKESGQLRSRIKQLMDQYPDGLPFSKFLPLVGLEDLDRMTDAESTGLVRAAQPGYAFETRGEEKWIVPTILGGTTPSEGQAH